MIILVVNNLPKICFFFCRLANFCIDTWFNSIWPMKHGLTRRLEVAEGGLGFLTGLKVTLGRYPAWLSSINSHLIMLLTLILPSWFGLSIDLSKSEQKQKCFRVNYSLHCLSHTGEHTVCILTISWIVEILKIVLFNAFLSSLFISDKWV